MFRVPEPFRQGHAEAECTQPPSPVTGPPAAKACGARHLRDNVHRHFARHSLNDDT